MRFEKSLLLLMIYTNNTGLPIHPTKQTNLLLLNRFRIPCLIIICSIFSLTVHSCSISKDEVPASKLPDFGNEAAALADAEGFRPEPPDYNRYADLKIPPLPPAKTLELFDLEEGFRIELVAHEPDIIDPVAMDIDRDGRLWVVEMQSYMPIHDKEDQETSIKERVPESRVVVLEDTNGDGRMDKSRVFMDNLVLPRAIKVMDQGVLIATPPNVWFIQDTTGNGIGDTMDIIYDSYGEPDTDNVEHMPNGLMWGMDNWLHSSHSGVESIRFRNGVWETRPFEELHQWGITQDDWGRLYSSHNTRTLTTHFVPYGYSHRHPDFDLEEGIYENIAESETMWPAHATGVNRGYRINNEVREDGTLKRSTSTTGPVIYRGDQFGEEYRGNAFVPEPAANLIKRFVGIDENPGEIEASALFAYRDREFLTSTDERFRPVNMYNAPDGSLYVIDMYRGLFQHARFLTDHLREYTVEHGLHLPAGGGQFGRIYRIVREDRDINYDTPKLSGKEPIETAGFLTSENGLLRDLAQQILVQRSPAEAIPELESMALDGTAEFYTRLQALWTLEGYDQVHYPSERLSTVAVKALDDTHPRIRAAAIRILESHIRQGSEELFNRLVQLADKEPDPYPLLQLIASAGESDTPQSLHLIAKVLNDYPENKYFREMAITGVYQREVDLMDLLRKEYHWQEGEDENRDWILIELAQAAMAEPDPELQLTGEELRLFELGEQQYRTCLPCHGGQGQGVEGLTLPLTDSQWAEGDPAPLIRILLQGFRGGAEEQGKDVAGVMPAHRFMSDKELAGVLTYIRHSWDIDAGPIFPHEVEEVRNITEDRTSEWTPEELRGFVD